MRLSGFIDLQTSLLASTVRGWRGTMMNPAKRQPEQLIELYDFEACPYCRLVREALSELDIDAMIYPCPDNGTRFRPLVRERGGREQFPYMVDPNTETEMYESEDIIAYLSKTYADREIDTGLLKRGLDVTTSAVSSLVRSRRGGAARPSKAPEKPLELFSFESSPFSRRVREVLCELEIPYQLRNTPKAIAKDLGPPELRKRLFPNEPVVGRNRVKLLERTGRVQVPYLIDPNTGTEMYESGPIMKYLKKTYGA